MDPIAKRVLEAFDELGRERLELSTLAETALRPADQPASVGQNMMRGIVAELVENGWLRPADTPDAFARTEEGRLALAGPRDVTLYSRPGCHLCEEAKAQMALLLREFGARLREVNIDADPALRERYTNDVPVVFLGSRKVAKHRVDVAQIRRQLARASAHSR